jgi:hypothetical protein
MIVISNFELTMEDFMRNIIIGIVIGIAVSGGIAWAAITTKIVLVDQNANYIGTSSNPVYITSP